MRVPFSCGLGLLPLLAVWLTYPLQAEPAGSAVLYTGAQFITLDPAQPTAAAIFVDGGRIRAVHAKAPAEAPRGARLVDLKGGVVVPGLHDAHFHVGGLGEALTNVDLTGTRSAAEVVERVKARLATHSKGAWLVGRGWDQNDWACGKPPCGGQMPTRQLLDVVAPDTPVFLERIDGHAAWLNSAALGHARDLGKDPEGGRILRDAKGEPTGVLVDTAMDLVTLPRPEDKALEDMVRLGAERAAAAGLTAVHAMGVSNNELAAMLALDRRGELPLRIYAYLAGMEEGVLDHLPPGGIQRAERRVEIRGVKLFADGALGSRGAALLAPYSDEKGHVGLLVTEPKVLEERSRAVHDRGFQVAIHAIGDRANREVLEMFGRLGPQTAQRRHRVEHAQVVDPADWRAFKNLGVIASMQPTHCTSDMPWAEARLGKARLAGAYAWKSLLGAGAVLAFGSDAPVESEKPLWGLYAARTRTDHTGKPKGGWQAQELLDGVTALKGFTQGAAYAVGHEDELGTLKVGTLADFTWLEADPTTAEPQKLLSMKVLGTAVGGVLRRN
ncbi:MAG: amidohydrolase [Myxococcota bacterium]